jgi:tRNA-specific 2-thiouridylase
VREIAETAGLPVSHKDESQDFFNGDYSDLMETSDRVGNIRNTEGKILGTHKGIWKYTIGQRKGLGVYHTKPLYVLKIDEKENEIIVGEREFLFSKGLIAKECNIFFDTLPGFGSAKIRSNSYEHACQIERIDKNQIKVEFDNPQSAVTPGQSVVLYDNDIVLGGGIIDRAF